jgi:signal transduction histidine kinase
VRLPPGARVWAEPIRLQQILLNLLSNALKYSAPGTPVDIEAHVVTDEQRPARARWHQRPVPILPMMEISIRDYGLGIPPEQQHLLFQRFVRLPRDLESNVMGTGLGLYLAKSMAEAMGGSIRIRSSGVPGEGSTMIVQLPVAPLDMEHPSEESAPIYVEHYTNPRLAVPTIATPENR